jgi:hypothetical protein
MRVNIAYAELWLVVGVAVAVKVAVLPRLESIEASNFSGAASNEV